MKRNIHCAVIALTLLFSCSTAVVFRTNAPNAQLQINGSYKGSLPTSVTLSDAVWNSYTIHVTAPNYKDYYGKVKKEVKWGPILMSWFYLFPLIWCYGPQHEQFILMQEDRINEHPNGNSNEKIVQERELGTLSIVEFQIDPRAKSDLYTGKDLALYMETFLSKNKKIELSNRINLDTVLSEKELLMTDLFDAGNFGSMKGFNGAKNVLIGQVKKIGDGITVFVKIVDLDTNIQSQIYVRGDIMVNSQGVKALTDALQSIADEIAGK